MFLVHCECATLLSSPGSDASPWNFLLVYYNKKWQEESMKRILFLITLFSNIFSWQYYFHFLSMGRSISRLAGGRYSRSPRFHPRLSNLERLLHYLRPGVFSSRSPRHHWSTGKCGRTRRLANGSTKHPNLLPGSPPHRYSSRGLAHPLKSHESLFLKASLKSKNWTNYLIAP